MQEWNGIWTRVAVVRRGDDQDETMVWRLFPDRRSTAVHVRHWQIIGGAGTPKNIISGEDPRIRNMIGLRAWIDFYGDLRIKDGIAEITLRNPDIA